MNTIPAQIQPSQPLSDSDKHMADTKFPHIITSYSASAFTEDDTASISSREHRGSVSTFSSISEDDDLFTPIAPRHNVENHVPPSLDMIMARDWTDAKQKTVSEPFEYVISLGGKGFRKQLVDALNVWMGVDAETCAIIEDTVGMLHNASLMIDDIQDGSDLRRGCPSTHIVHGLASTINSANLVYFEAMTNLRKLENWPEAFAIFSDELINLHRGQGMELYWRDHSEVPCEADYLQMIANKTGGLFRLILRLLQVASKQSFDFLPVTDALGLMFQVMDDYSNLKDQTMRDQKGYCEDLTEGKFSYPICHAAWNDNPHMERIKAILRERTEDNEVKAWIVDRLEEAGSLEYTRQRVEDLYARVQQMLAEAPEKNPRFEKLAEFIVSKVR